MFNLKRIFDLPVFAGLNYLGQAIVLDDGTQVTKQDVPDFISDVLNDSVLTGQPVAPTPSPGDDSQRVATTGWTQTELANLGLNAATTGTLGTVRTDIDEASPVVYTKTTTDSLLNNIGFDIDDLEAANTARIADITAVSNRVSTLEGLTISQRLALLEQRQLELRSVATITYPNYTVAGNLVGQNTALLLAAPSLEIDPQGIVDPLVNGQIQLNNTYTVPTLWQVNFQCFIGLSGAGNFPIQLGIGVQRNLNNQGYANTGVYDLVTLGGGANLSQKSNDINFIFTLQPGDTCLLRMAGWNSGGTRTFDFANLRYTVELMRTL